MTHLSVPKHSPALLGSEHTKLVQNPAFAEPHWCGAKDHQHFVQCLRVCVCLCMLCWENWSPRHAHLTGWSRGQIGELCSVQWAQDCLLLVLPQLLSLSLSWQGLWVGSIPHSLFLFREMSFPLVLGCWRLTPSRSSQNGLWIISHKLTNEHCQTTQGTCLHPWMPSLTWACTSCANVSFFWS